MKIRLGYACISETLKENYKTYTYTKYKEEQDRKKLEKIIISNLLHLKELLIYNNKNNIHFYRITSNLIPLATIKEANINYTEPYKKYYQELKKENKDIDIMIEAKKKDEALFRLVRELKYKTNIKFIDETSFMI